ncbi:hypothetical protein [Acinetobacter sp.]|uniref:hypothetical protein n=1 Tax=Acinetobacter sp. TaxID=472 RepID=UPI000C09BD29|nr:hypothetical protein [Acinetobacter sp.]MAK30906.1 hypothetical protein [Acinetobacter sp.]QDP47182.1 MAG: hypothetical protein GOVbin655_16 [Prokaryotic dsDNA virus sp.]|tara:strand:- start:538 stop:1401 length:864 start_codon:yes stop_codon:yes gene_type:complete
MNKNQTDGNSVTADSTDDFFEALENEVNSAIQEDTTEKVSQDGSDKVTQKKEASKVSANEWESNNNPYKKRYSDSSREASKLNDEMTRLKPFVPLLEAMRKDGNLVEHVKDYLVNGGAPAKTVKDKLGLKEDFEYNAQEAMVDPDSDSAKVLNSHVDAIVSKKVNAIIDGEKAAIKEAKRKSALIDNEKAFKEKHGMNDKEFQSMVAKAKEHTLTLEDIYYLMNKDKTTANVASNTKEQMLDQMKNMKNMPASVGGVNSAGSANKSEDDKIFESILGSDDKLDSMFG